jgi:hypothetical protein
LISTSISRFLSAAVAFVIEAVGAVVDAADTGWAVIVVVGIEGDIAAEDDTVLGVATFTFDGAFRLSAASAADGADVIVGGGVVVCVFANGSCR